MAKEKKYCSEKDCSRLNKVGGQAVIEGVMMKAGERTVTTCRKEDKSLVVYDGNFVSVRKKHKKNKVFKTTLLVTLILIGLTVAVGFLTPAFYIHEIIFFKTTMKKHTV